MAFTTTWMQQLLPYAGFTHPPFAWVSTFPQPWLRYAGSLLGHASPMNSQQQGQPPHHTHLHNTEYFEVEVKIPSHLHTRWIRRAGRGAVGRKVAASTCTRAHIPPTTHWVCVTFRATCFCNSFFMSFSDATQVQERETKYSQAFSALTPLCCSEALEMICAVLLIPQCPVHVLCRPHTTSPICKPSRTASKLGTHLLIFQEFQPQMPKALSYGSTVKVASFFH